MNTTFEQISGIFRTMPLSRKILMAAVLLLLGAGFFAIYLYGQKAVYQPLFGKLSAEDAAAVVEKLREQRVPFQIEGGGTLILVPSDQVYDLRLTLAGMGLPKGGSVGFELFDEANFGTTEFVQKLNYQRALQGELARTIMEFQEVIDARVMIVMPKESVFIEESKPASASVLLKLHGRLPKGKVAAVVNLVASAVEDLVPEMVTVVDTQGNVLSKRNGASDKIGELADSQLEYKLAYENNMARRIQTMLEGIVGQGKAIVRVASDMDFSRVDVNEEIFDPDVQVVRSRQSNAESADSTMAGANGISSVNPVPAAGTAGTVANQRAEKSQKQNETVNYEINRTVRRTVKPVAEVTRVSVAAVLDGNYTAETDKDGRQIRKYEPRSQAELDQFASVVQKAMGYSADREDQVTVESFPFSTMDDMGMAPAPGVDWPGIFRRHGHLAGYAVLIVVAFMFLVKPLRKGVQEMAVHSRQASLSVRAEQEQLPGGQGMEALPAPQNLTGRQKAAYLARQDIDKTAEQVRGWLGEAT